MPEDTVQPTEDQPQELQEQPTDEVVEDQPEADDSVEVTDNNDNENVEPEVTESEPEIVEEDEGDFDVSQYSTPNAQMQTIPPIDMNQFVDAEGNLDLLAYNQAQEERFAALQEQMAGGLAAAQQAAVERVNRQAAYAKLWEKAEDVLPAIKGKTPEAKELRDLVHSYHANSALIPGGKALSPAQAATKVKKMLGMQKAEGIRSANESRTVQSAATLASPNPPAQTEGTSLSSLKNKMRTGSVAERNAAVDEMLKRIL